jgi:anti-sigma regulatory factor (Ser/Thr protein kinase)
MRPRPPLTVEATLASIAAVGAYLTAAASEAGLSSSDAYRLRLAADELATNIIQHGYQENGLSGHVVVRAEPVAGGLRVTLEDDAPPYDPRTRAMPDTDDLAAPIDERGVGGLGIYLTLKSVDDFHYERRGGTNVTTFEVRRRSGEAAR